MPPYVYERQVEYWTSRQVEEYFLDAGYEILVFPITPGIEKKVPTDFIFYEKTVSKIFGFQFKALYTNDHDYWPINLQQQTVLINHPWIYYCLSELREIRDQRAALHLARIVVPSVIGALSQVPFTTHPNDRIWYRRWGAFYTGLINCKFGVQINTLSDLAEILEEFSLDNLPRELRDFGTHIFTANVDAKKLVHFLHGVNSPE